MSAVSEVIHASLAHVFVVQHLTVSVAKQDRTTLFISVMKQIHRGRSIQGVFFLLRQNYVVQVRAFVPVN